MAQGGVADFVQDETSATITLHRPARDLMIHDGVIPMLRGTMLRHQDAGFVGLIQIGSLMSEGTSGDKVQANIPCPFYGSLESILEGVERGLTKMNELPGEADLIVRLRLV